MKWWKALLAAMLLAALAACGFPDPVPTEAQTAATELTELTEPTEPAEMALLQLSQRLSGSFVCLRGREDRCLTVTRLSGGESQVTLYEIAGGLVLGQLALKANITQAEILEDGTVALLDGATGRTWHYDSRLAACLEVWEPGRSGLWNDGASAVTSGWRELILQPQNARQLYLLRDRENSRLEDLSGSLALLITWESLGELWDLKAGQRWQLPAESCWAGVVCDPWVVYLEYEGGAARLYRWNFRLEEAQAADCTCCTLQELETHNRAQAAALRLETGMEIFFGQEGAAFNSLGDSGYLGRAETDPIRIHVALDTLADFVASYPAGIFREMVVEPQTGISLYLAGGLTAAGEESLASVYGFTTVLSDRRVVVMNLGESDTCDLLGRSLAHEFMHVMEDRIYACARETGLEYLNYWDSFPPGQGAYFYSYFDENGQEVSDPAYTPADTAGTEICFLDSYSRSYPLEDRGRIMEYLFAGPEGPGAGLFQSGVLRDKAQYLCAVIRVCFPSCGQAGSLPWEALVEPVPFSQYEEAVRTYEPVALG